MADLPLSIHYQQMEEWLSDRRSVFGKRNSKEFEALMQLAPRLVQQVQYDIPAVQRLVKKCGTSVEECRRVCADADRVAAASVERRRRLLSDHGLTTEEVEGSGPTGQALEAAINRRIDEGCLRLTRELVAFAKSHVGAFRCCYNEVVSRAWGAAESPESLSHTFEDHFPWLTRAEEEHLLAFETAAPGAGDGERSEGETSAAAPQIDWGDGNSNVDQSCAGAVCLDIGGDASNAVEISWDAVEERVVGACGEDEDEAAAAAPPSPNGHRPSIDVSRTRDRTSLLMELAASACFAGERGIAKDERFHGYLDAAALLTESLTSSIDAAFVRMRTNFREREMFEERLAYFDRSITAAQARKSSHEVKLVESARELERLEPELRQIIRAATETRDACVANLSVIFPGRQILIVGDLNKYI